MHKNEAISRVAERAMEQIYDIAQFAISKITDGAVGDIEPMVQTSFTEVAARANMQTMTDALSALKHETENLQVEVEKQKRKPRTPKTQEVLEPTPTTENDFVKPTKEIEVEPEDVKVLEERPSTEGTTAVIEHDEDDNPEFPNHPDSYFTSDVEQARQLCRKLLSKLVSKDGHDSARKAIVETTQKVKVTDFDANDCMTFYRKYRNNV